MALLSKTELNKMEDLFVHELKDLYDAEKRLTEALPKMAKAASTSALVNAYQEHLKETETHVKRLEQVFQSIGRKPEESSCEAMKGLVKEGSEIIDAKGDAAVKDAALIAAAQRVEHYEMAGYGTVRRFAEYLGHTQAAELLQKTLDEEVAADHKLTRIAEDMVNARATRA